MFIAPPKTGTPVPGLSNDNSSTLVEAKGFHAMVWQNAVISVVALWWIEHYFIREGAGDVMAAVVLCYDKWLSYI